MSFRLKLLLAMMLVVGGVTGATLYITQQRVEATYRSLFEQQFEAQLRFMAALEKVRLSRVPERCREMAELVRFRGHMRRLKRDIEVGEEGYILESTLKAYQTAAGELAEMLQEAVFFRLIDAQGTVLAPPRDVDAGMRHEQGRASLEARLEKVVKEMASQDLQAIGYLSGRAEDGESLLTEVVITRIYDPLTGEQFGMLSLAFPVDDFAGMERGLERDSGGTKAGLLVEDELYMSGLDPEARERLAGEVRKGLELGETGTDAGMLMLGGVPHRAFFEVLSRSPYFPPAYQVCLFSLAEALAEQSAFRSRILFFGGLGLVGALLLSMLLSHGLAVPIHELVRGTNEIQRGNFQFTVPVRSGDEIGQLARSFNEMAGGLEQKEKYRNVLNLVADREVARELMNGRVALGGEIRQISTLFCDIRGFTSLTQEMDPAEVIQMLNEHFTPLTQVVYDHHGVVDKFVGDLIMAIFGAPKSYGNDALNSVRAAWGMIEARQALNERSACRIEMGIGIATGPVVAGCMGSADRLNYTVLGQRVNLASRLCSQAGRMEVVIDATTRAELGDAVEVEALPGLRLKGFAEAVQAFKVVQLQQRRMEKVQA